MKAKILFLAAFFLTRGLCAMDNDTGDLGKSWAVLDPVRTDELQQLEGNNINMLRELEQQLATSKSNVQKLAVSNAALQRKLAESEKNSDVLSRQARALESLLAQQYSEHEALNEEFTKAMRGQEERAKWRAFVAFGAGYCTKNIQFYLSRWLWGA